MYTVYHSSMGLPESDGRIGTRVNGGIWVAPSVAGAGTELVGGGAHSRGVGGKEVWVGARGRRRGRDCQSRGRRCRIGDVGRRHHHRLAVRTAHLLAEVSTGHAHDLVTLAALETHGLHKPMCSSHSE